MKKDTKGDVCACCGKTSGLGWFDICDVCGWSNDYAQVAHPDMTHGDNTMSLNEAKEAYRKGLPID